MKKLIIGTALAAIVAVPAMAQRSDAKVSGQGRLLQERTFSINAFINADGSATGQAVLVRRDFPNDTETQPLNERLTITCANRVDANTVVFRGEVERSNNSSLPEIRYWALRDNGQGRNAPADELSYVVPTNFGQDDPLACLQLTDASFTLEPIIAGNIKVQD